LAKKFAIQSIRQWQNKDTWKNLNSVNSVNGETQKQGHLEKSQFCQFSQSVNGKTEALGKISNYVFRQFRQFCQWQNRDTWKKNLNSVNSVNPSMAKQRCLEKSQVRQFSQSVTVNGKTGPIGKQIRSLFTGFCADFIQLESFSR